MHCLQCQSKRIVRNVRCVDLGHSNLKYEIKLEVHANPDAMIFKNAQQAALRANVCADCGFVMFDVTVEDAQRLEKYQK